MKKTFGLILVLVLALETALDAAQIGLNFTGAHQGFFGDIVPDVMGSVGPHHIVEHLNGSVAVYDKTTGTRLARQVHENFWDAALARAGGERLAEFSFDPRVVYDPTSQRWFAVAADGISASTSVLLAVSDGSSPLPLGGGMDTAWRAFRLDGDPGTNPNTRFADFPTMGVDRDAVTISARLFGVENAGEDGPYGTAIYTIPKSDLLLPTPTVANGSQFAFDDELAEIAPTITAHQGVLDFGPADGRSMLFIVTSELGVERWNLVNVAESRANGASLASRISIFTSPLELPVSADQPGDVQNLHVFGQMESNGENRMRFFSHLVQQGDRAWGVHPALIGGRTGIRWYEIDLAANAIIQSGSIGDPALDLIYPSIAVNPFGDAVIGFTATGEDLFPSAYAVVGDTLGGVTTFGDLIELKAGVGTYLGVDGRGRNRWGDYSTTVLDPSDPRRFWTFQEFTRARNSWAVQITEIIVPEPNSFALSAVTISLFCAAGLSKRSLRLRRSCRLDQSSVRQAGATIP